MFSKVTCIIALFAAAFLLVKADQINIYSPPQSAEYHLKDVMDVRYKVKYIGQTKIWTATTSLINVNTNTPVEGFPELKWVSGASENDTSIHDVWNVPSDITPGTYAFIVTGNTTETCAQTASTTSEVARCDSTVQQNVTFTIAADSSN